MTMTNTNQIIIKKCQRISINVFKQGWKYFYFDCLSFKVITSSVNHTEGGWPKDVKLESQEQKNKVKGFFLNGKMLEKKLKC